MRANFPSPARARPNSPNAKKSLFHRRFLQYRTTRARSIGVGARNVALSKPRAQHTRRRAPNARDVHVSLSGDCFFRCAVVNEMQCVSIRDRTEDDISHVSWLGGQQWRNVERRRQRRRKRRRRPSVGRRGSSLHATSRSSHLNVSKIASYGPVCAME